jgi:acyl-CoA dehydrogenase
MRFQSYAYGTNHWLLDPDLRTILSGYWSGLPEYEQELSQFGELAGGRAYRVAYHVDHDSPPTLVTHDLGGNRIDRARLCPEHATLLKDMSWINRPPYQGGSWLHHFALGYLLADPGLYCSLIVTNQTAYAIHKYAPEHARWLEALLSGKMWGATWMTETQGGSDLGANTTTAYQSEDGWRLDGDTKFFASNAGLADLAIVTARPLGAPPGPKGIALFLVPRLDDGGRLNYLVRRLKDKSATRAVPTGEVELRNSLAYLIGEAELGIYYTLENLTVSRLANAVGAIGLAHKARLEAYLRAQQRTAFGIPLIEHPLMRCDLIDLAVRTAGGLALVFHAIDAFDRAWNQTPPYTNSYHYARFLSHLAKNRTSEHSAQVTRLAMEIFGGLGFLEETPLPRLHRESLVTSIWEGTSNIQALDMLEAMHKKSAHETFLDEVVGLLSQASTPEAQVALRSLNGALQRLADQDSRSAQWYSKDALNRFADAATVALLYRLAETGGERYSKLASLYTSRFLGGEAYPSWALDDRSLWQPGEA